jgi:hypothetical protein
MLGMPFFQDSIGLMVLSAWRLGDYGGKRILTFFRTTEPAFTPTQFVAHAHQQLTQATFLPGWEDQNASHIVIVPAHLFLAEEAYDLSFGVLRIRKHEKVVSECGDIVEDRLSVEEELGEQREILGIQLFDMLASRQTTLGCDELCTLCSSPSISYIDWSAV